MRDDGLYRSVYLCDIVIFEDYGAPEGLKADLPADLQAAGYPGAPGHLPPILGPGEALPLAIGALVVQGVAWIAGAHDLIRRAVLREYEADGRMALSTVGSRSLEGDGHGGGR